MHVHAHAQAGGQRCLGGQQLRLAAHGYQQPPLTCPPALGPPVQLTHSDFVANTFIFLSAFVSGVRAQSSACVRQKGLYMLGNPPAGASCRSAEPFEPAQRPGTAAGAAPNFPTWPASSTAWHRPYFAVALAAWHPMHAST
eukprot:scaffold24041_cov23-Tisochrysis_lutea.AAC.2